MKPITLPLILCISLLFSFCPTANAESNPVSWWKFDEGSGSTAYDSAGSNNGIIIGATWSDDPCRGICLSFNGSDDYVALSSFTVNTDDGTISLWFKTSADFSANYEDMGYLISSDSLYLAFLGVAGNGTAPYGIYGETNTDNEYFVNTMDVIPVGEWNHIAVSFYNKTATTYLNGQSIQTLQVIRPILVLSCVGGITHKFFNGKIDDVRFYDKALSTGEIWQLYEEGLGLKASKPNPANGATDAAPDTVLSWSPEKNVASHDVYFGTDFIDVNEADTLSPEYKGNFDVNTFDPLVLDLATTYYWRVDEVNEPNLWKGNVWNFTTVTGKATNPQPSDGQYYVSTNPVILSWSPGVYARSHDVYFGDNFIDVNEANTLSQEYKGNCDINSYDPGDLEEDTYYYWRIDEVNDPNLWKGDVWSFNNNFMCVVPDVVGMTQADANVAITNAGLVVGTIADGNGNSVAIGSVYAQGTAAGTVVNCGTAVSYNVASYCMKSTHPDYTKWVANGRPKCWCYAKHCYGDIDGAKDGIFWVGISDKNILVTYLNKFPNPPLPFAGICADVTHSKEGLFWVSNADKDIFVQYRGKLTITDCDNTHINFWCTPGSTTLGCP